MRRTGGDLKGRLTAELRVFLVLVAISLVLLVISTRNVMNFRYAGISVFSGARGAVFAVSSFASDTVLAVGELARLREDYAELQERVARYERLERTAAEIGSENVRLREQLGFSLETSFRHVPARIVARDPDNLFSALVINKGTRAGIARDMPVIAWQGGTQALVGKVVQARAFESVVVPVFDASLFVSARHARSRFEGIVEGRGSPELGLVMRYVPRRALDEISRGDMVVSSGLGGIYPPDINIGRVDRVIHDEHETSMELELYQLVDFARLEHVFVIETLDASVVSGETDATGEAAGAEVPTFGGM